MLNTHTHTHTHTQRERERERERERILHITVSHSLIIREYHRHNHAVDD